MDGQIIATGNARLRRSGMGGGYSKDHPLASLKSHQEGFLLKFNSLISWVK
jgi:hypothetical protein